MRAFLLTLVFFILSVLPATSQEAGSTTDAADFPQRVVDTIVEIKVVANHHASNRHAEASRERLLALRDRIAALTASPELDRLPEDFLRSLHPAFLKVLDAGADIVLTPGFHYTEVEAIVAAFRKHLKHDEAVAAHRDIVLLESIATTFGTDWYGFYSINFTLLNERFRGEVGYRRALRLLARHNGACGQTDSGPRRSAELCIADIATRGFKASGSPALALDWARERERFLADVSDVPPADRIASLVELAELELDQGWHAPAAGAIGKARAIAAGARPNRALLARMEAVEARLSIRGLATSQAPSAALVDRWTAGFDPSTGRGIGEMARAIAALHAGRIDGRLAASIDRTLAKAGVANRRPSACRKGRKPAETAREVTLFAAYFVPYHAAPGDLATICRFIFERNPAAKVALARRLLDPMLENAGEFGTEGQYLEGLAGLAEAFSILGYDRAAEVARSAFLQDLARNYPDAAARDSAALTLAPAVVDAHASRALAAVASGDRDGARIALAEAARIASLRLAAEWRAGSQDIADAIARLEGPLARVTEAWHALAVRGAASGESDVAGAFEAFQLARLDDVATAIQVGLRRSATLSPEVAGLIAEVEAVHSRLAHLERIAAGVQFDFDDGVSSERAHLSRQYDEARARLSTALPVYEDFASVTPLNFQEARTRLGERDALVFLSPATDRTAAFVLTRAAAAFRSLSEGEETLAPAIADLRRQLDPEVEGNDGAGFDVELAHRLHQLLLAPFTDTLAEVDHLFVVADGSLTSLPLHVLVTNRPPAGAGMADVAWLAKRFATTYLPSVVDLRPADVAAATSSGRFMAFADPDFGSERNDAAKRPAAEVTRSFRGAVTDLASLPTIPSLPETRTEVEHVARTVPGGDVDLFLGQDATEAMVKSLSRSGRLAATRILYFATHAVVPGEIDDASEAGLILTLPKQPSDEDDGLLSASEIARLRLDADWVVLSACNTAAAGDSDGRALSGLARSFLRAGARALLVSHWPVISDAAVEITTRTFTGMASEPGLPRAVALQRAMLEIATSTQGDGRTHPSYWAPFTLIGTGG
ncbi:MAG: CHAT domain-containing protein [Rhizobiales bacterium]|nr:CHAT domain-containing protein [Hyphomicrobiales bacterium]